MGSKTSWYMCVLLFPCPSYFWEDIFSFSRINLAVVGIGGSPKARACSSGEGEGFPSSELKDDNNKRDMHLQCDGTHSRAKWGRAFEEKTSSEPAAPEVSGSGELVPPRVCASTGVYSSKSEGTRLIEVCSAFEEVR